MEKKSKNTSKAFTPIQYYEKSKKLRSFNKLQFLRIVYESTRLLGEMWINKFSADFWLL